MKWSFVIPGRDETQGFCLCSSSTKSLIRSTPAHTFTYLSKEKHPWSLNTLDPELPWPTREGRGRRQDAGANIFTTFFYGGDWCVLIPWGIWPEQHCWHMKSQSLFSLHSGSKALSEHLPKNRCLKQRFSRVPFSLLCGSGWSLLFPRKALRWLCIILVHNNFQSISSLCPMRKGKIIT